MVLILGKVPNLMKGYSEKTFLTGATQDALVEIRRNYIGKKRENIEMHEGLFKPESEEKLFNNFEDSALTKFSGGAVENGTNGASGAALFADHFS